MWTAKVYSSASQGIQVGRTSVTVIPLEYLGCPWGLLSHVITVPWLQLE